MTQPLSGIISCVTAYTSLPSALPHTITPSGELQKRCTEQSSENNQWSLTDKKRKKEKPKWNTNNTKSLCFGIWHSCIYFFYLYIFSIYVWLRHWSVIPISVSSCSLSCPNEVPSAGALSWLGSATPPKVSDIWARGSEPAMRTLSRAQSLWSAPSWSGCHQRTRTPSWRAAGGSSTFTNLSTDKKTEESHRYPAGQVFTDMCSWWKKLTQAWCTDHRRSLSVGASWFLHSNCTPEALPGSGCWVGSCSRTWSRTGWTQRWSGSGPQSPADGCKSEHKHNVVSGVSQYWSVMNGCLSFYFSIKSILYLTV